MRYVRQQQSTDTVVHLEGRLDERSDFAGLQCELEAAPDPVVFDLSRVRSSNSAGVLLWLRFIRTLAGRAVRLRDCSPAVVTQLCTVHGFFGGASVESFYVTYVCDTCRIDRTLLWRQHQQFVPGGWISEPLVKCEGCGCRMEQVELRDALAGMVLALGARGA